MTDTGQVPGEGLPESAGMVEQPGVSAHGAYTYLSETTAEDEDLLLPGAQGAWGNEVPPPPPEPVVETVHEPDPHERDGRDSGSVDLGGVRLPQTGPVSVPPSPILSVPHDPATAPAVPRRPLHLGPPIPDTSASPVRSLADRGPAGAPVRQPGPPAGGPEYLDAQPLRDLAPQGAAPWGAAQAAPQAAPQPQVSPQAPAAETVVPAADPAATSSGPAQATLARLAAQAATASATTEAAAAAHAAAQEAQGTGPVAQEQDPAQGVPGPVGAHPAAGGEGAEAAHAPDAAQGSAPAQDAEAVPGPDAAPASENVQSPEAAHVTEALPGSEGARPVPDAEATEQPPAPQGVPVHGDAEALGEPLPEAPEAPEALEGTESPEAPEAVSAPVPDETQAQEVPTGTPETQQPVEAIEAVEAVEAVLPSETVEPAAPASGAHPSSEAAELTEGARTSDGSQAPEHVPSPEDTPVPDAGIQSGDNAPEQVRTAVPAAEPPQAEPGPAAPDAVPTAPTGHDLPEQVQGPQPGYPPAGDREQPAAPAPESLAPESLAPESVAQESLTPEALAPETSAPEQPDAAPQASEAGPAEPGVPDAAAPETVHPEDGTGLQAPAAQPTEEPAAPPVQVPGPVDGSPAPAAEQVPAQTDPAAAAAGSVPAQPQPQPDQQPEAFVPVQGAVPDTPHLVTVPAPREADQAPAHRDEEPHHDVVQHAEDLDTRAADQEESTAEVAEARQPTGPAAPGYDDAEREAVLKVMRERRDIRNGFRSDPIPHEVLLRVLEAAHTAPSVGHSQPWDFVVIRSAETRRSMHELAMRQRDAYAKSLPKGRAKQFKELKIEAILDTPVNIVVTADPTRGGRHTLGRHTQPQMAPYSAALAVENLWLAARAEGLGVGWVSFFDEREMVRALGLPEHLEVIAYLCVGYVDEFPDEPELLQAGWSKRRPLSWVVHEETYGRRALPGEDPHDLLAETVSQIRPLDAKALGEAWERQKRMTKPAGALGMLEIISAQLSGLSRQCPPPIPEPAAVAIFAGDHGVHAQGVTPWPQEVTAQMVANFLGGGAVCNAFAGQVGAEVCVIDVGVAAELPATPGLLPRKVRAGTSDMTTGPAMTREEAKQAIEVGIETARDLVAAGNKALLTGEMGIANTTASAALISVYTGADPAEVTGRGTGINDETLARKTEVVRRALELHKPDPADPIGVLAAIGGFEHAAMVGLLLGGASLRTPVILDGVSAGAAALVARAIAPEVLAACIAGHRSAEPGHVAALNKLGLRPLVDLDLRLGEGTGALLALPLVQSTARAMHEVATFDSAGVTEK